MRRVAPQFAAAIAFLAVPAIAYLLLRSSPGFDVSPPALAEEHFWIVSGVTLLSAVLAFLAAATAIRSGNTRLLFVGMAFLSLAGFFAVHGMGTPGYFLGIEHFVVVGFSARMSVLMASMFLALSAFNLPPRLSRAVMSYRVPILAGWLAVLVSFAIAGLAYPNSVPPRIMDQQLFLNSTLVATLFFCAVAAARYFESYMLSRLPIHGALVAGSVLIAEAQIPMHFSAVWSYSWWLYHLMLLAAMSVVLWALFVEYARGRNPMSAVETLSLSGALAQINAGQTQVLRVLAGAIEAKDGYLHGHGARVSALSLAMGERLKLSKPHLREVTQGGFLHDIGKIAIPDRILHKPGRLTDDEYELIKTHSARGEAILKDGGLSPMELAVIRHHHERFDGRGYPDRLIGEGIPIEVRIVAIADVYDSLRSDRAYRGAMSRQEAMQLMSEESGTHFDPRVMESFYAVVDAWERDHAMRAMRPRETVPSRTVVWPLKEQIA